MNEIDHISESERRIATVMFADIAGFITMSEKMDPEQVTGIMNECFTMMEECIEQHGGTIDKFIGDCVMALFGVPKALEDSPQQAVNTAIELRNRLLDFNREKRLSIPLNIHIGINTGPVIAGMVGGFRKREYTVMGDTVNLASLLEEASAAGQILVGDTTYKATKGGFEYKTFAPLSLKGKAEPVSVYELLSDRESMYRLQPGSHRRIFSETVGRNNELQSIELKIMKAINGEGSIINVMGEAGIGKSRLIADLKNLAVMRQASFLEGRAISVGANLGYHIVIDLMNNWAKITEEDSVVGACNKLENTIRSTYPEAFGEVFPFIATLMGMKLVGSYAERIKGIEGEALEKLIQKNVRDLVTRMSQTKPLVLILEDLHWADTSSLEFIESMYRLAEKERIVFINVFRPGYSETGDRISRTIKELYPKRCMEIIVQPLNERQTSTLITNLLNIKNLPQKFQEQVIRRAGGNPYFIEEVVRSFIDENVVAVKDGEFKVEDKFDDVRIPDTINEVLMARIDRLDQGTKNLVRIASVIGRNFFYRILADIVPESDGIDSRLEYLKEIQLIQQRERMEEVEYLFKHALAQEVAYESILVQRRKELHRIVADSIARIFHERLYEFYGMLVYHYSQGEDLEKTEKYLIMAGEESLKASASIEALHYYQQALELYSKKYGFNAEPEKMVVLYKSIALALFNKGQYADSYEYFDNALAFYGEKIPVEPLTKTLKFLLGFSSFLLGIYFPFLKWKRKPSQRDKEIISLLHRKCSALAYTNTKEMFIQSMFLLRRLTRVNLSEVENGVGIMASISCLFSWSGISFRLSKKVMSFVKDKIQKSDARAILYYKFSELMHNYLSGDRKQEFQYDDDLINRNIGNGEFFYVSSYFFFLSGLSIERENTRTVQRIVQKMSDIGETYDNNFFKIAKFYVNTYLLLKIHELQGALLEAEEGIQFGIDKADFGIRVFYLYYLKARAQIMIGDLHGAQKSLTLADKIKSEVNVVPAHWGQYVLSKFALCLYQLEDTVLKNNHSKLSFYSSNALKAGKDALRIAKKSANIRTEVLKFMGIYYWTIGKQKSSFEWWFKAIQEGRNLNDRLELARTHFEVGKRLLTLQNKEFNGMTAEDHLEKAQVIFGEMDLQWDLGELEKIKHSS